MDGLIKHSETINKLLARNGVKFGIYKNVEFAGPVLPSAPLPLPQLHPQAVPGPARNEQVIYILVLTQTASAQEIASQITRRLGGSVQTVLSPAAEYPGFSYLKVYDRSASKSHMLEILKARTGAEKTVTFGCIPGQYDVYVHDDGGNSAVKALKKLFEGAPLEALGMD